MSAAVVLASQSSARRRLLEAAGVAFLAEPARIDEAEVKAALKAEGATAIQAAETLAEMKAQKVARRHPGAIVLGGDQLLECEGRWYDKPADREAASAQLAALAGRRHRLATATVAVRDGARLWHRHDQPTIALRRLTTEEIDAYLDLAGEEVLESVGCYRVEGLGARIIAAIEGDHYAVQGLPLLAVLDFLRQNGALENGALR